MAGGRGLADFLAMPPLYHAGQRKLVTERTMSEFGNHRGQQRLRLGALGGGLATAPGVGMPD